MHLLPWGRGEVVKRYHDVVFVEVCAIDFGLREVLPYVQLPLVWW